MKTAAQILFVVAGGGLGVALAVFDIHLWRLCHPTTPTWVYLFKP